MSTGCRLDTQPTSSNSASRPGSPSKRVVSFVSAVDVGARSGPRELAWPARPVVGGAVTTRLDRKAAETRRTPEPKTVTSISPRHPPARLRPLRRMAQIASGSPTPSKEGDRRPRAPPMARLAISAERAIGESRLCLDLVRHLSPRGRVTLREVAPKRCRMIPPLAPATHPHRRRDSPPGGEPPARHGNSPAGRCRGRRAPHTATILTDDVNELIGDLGTIRTCDQQLGYG